jgi:aspartokinase
MLSSRRLDVISVVASQTSVGLMVPSRDGLRAMTALEEGGLKGVQRAKVEDGLAVIGLVGGRLGSEPELLGRCLLDLAVKGIATRMSGSGGTGSAYYLIVEEGLADEAVRAVHATFWG